MDRFVDISFDCLPLRSIGRMDVPLDASPKFREVRTDQVGLGAARFIEHVLPTQRQVRLPSD